MRVDLVEMIRGGLHQPWVPGDPTDAGPGCGRIRDLDEEQAEAVAHVRPQDVRLKRREQRNIAWAASAQRERLGQAVRTCATG
ncbi:MAG TPA: hypothetical protein VE777_00905 [Gaiellales bacterium]|nr:hypothetical protein [Gaiellales bacterium]